MSSDEPPANGSARSTTTPPRGRPLLLVARRRLGRRDSAVAVGLLRSRQPTAERVAHRRSDRRRRRGRAASARWMRPAAAERRVCVDGRRSPSSRPGRRTAPAGDRRLDDDGAGLFVLDDAATAAPIAEPVPSPIYRSVEKPPFYLYWSPDGRQVTFLTSESDGLALRAAPADGSDDGGIVRRGAPDVLGLDGGRSDARPRRRRRSRRAMSASSDSTGPRRAGRPSCPGPFQAPARLE